MIEASNIADQSFAVTGHWAYLASGQPTDSNKEKAAGERVMALAAQMRELFRLDRRTARAIERRFIAPEIAKRDDIAERRAKLASIIAQEIIPHLVSLHTHVSVEAVIADSGLHEAEIDELAHIVIGSDPDLSVRYVAALLARGVTAEIIFAELLEPTAKLLGEMWSRDECDFIDVTLGVARLQKLLAIGNATYNSAAIVDRRRALVATAPGEQHHFGAAMVDQLMTASRWIVDSDHAASFDSLNAAVENNWYAVVALTLGTDGLIDDTRHAIELIRRHSCNKALRIMVGGSAFVRHPGLARAIGADATAANATAAVVVAQKLFDEGALGNWGIAKG